jgi:CRISPR-associated protein Cas1
MAEPWWRTTPQDLHRVSDRISSLYIERCHIDRDENAVVIVNKERTVRVPAAMLAVVLIGPGTRITHGAVSLLADSGTAMCWVGERGVRMYASGLGTSRGAGVLRRQAWLVSRRVERLAVARQMYSMRFQGEDVDGLTMQQLRGREGARVKKIYRSNADRSGVKWTGREYKPGDAFAAGDDVNRLLSAGHSCLYGLTHAAVVGIGASPALGFVHTGGAQSFVLDIADLYKAETTIPLAFDLAASGKTTERDMRLAFRNKVSDGKLLVRMVRDIKYLLLAEDVPDDAEDISALWDEELGAVSGGLNWADRSEAVELDQDEYVAVVGPELSSTDGLPF